MKIIRPWAFWRRAQYGAGFGILWVGIFSLLYFMYFVTSPSCFDGQQNGDEGGIDCDGACVRICAASITPPVVSWVDSFRIADGQYNAVAYIENRNQVAATRKLNYTLTLLDQGAVIAERSGTTILPPRSIYPIFEGPILTDSGRVPTETKLTLEPAEIWQPATMGREQFRVIGHELTATDVQPRLTAQIENTALTDADEVEVVVTIFNAAGKPVTASRTFIDRFLSRTTRSAVFTWPNSIAKTMRSCEVPSDVMLLIDRSGSMRADGDNPPQPLTDAKRAAETFLDQVKSNTKIGVVSYSTTPSAPLEQTLTSDLAAVRDSIRSITMGTDGVQYTNLGEAFKVAYEELASVRHRDNARKVIVLMTDGDVTMPFNPGTGQIDRSYASAYAKTQVELAKASETTIYTIGFGEFLRDANQEVVRDRDLLKNLSSDQESYFEAPTAAQLALVYEKIAGGLCEDGTTRVEILPKTDANFTPLR